MALDTFDVVMIDIWFVHLHADAWGLNLSVSPRAVGLSVFLWMAAAGLRPVFQLGQSSLAAMRVFDGSKAGGVGCGALRDRQEIAVSRY